MRIIGKYQPTVNKADVVKKMTTMKKTLILFWLFYLANIGCMIYNYLNGSYKTAMFSAFVIGFMTSCAWTIYSTISLRNKIMRLQPKE